MTAAFPAGFDVFLLLLACIVCFLAYWLTIENPKVREWFGRRYGQESGALSFFIFNKLWGSFLFGIIFTGIALCLFPGSTVAGFGLRLPDSGQATRTTLLMTLVLSIPFVAANFLRNRRIGRSGGDFGRYPEIRMGEWSSAVMAADVGFWCLYLLAYELLFRGALFLPLVERLGLWPAIGVNIALYSAVHVPKGAGEAIGALALGFALCLITYSTGSVATAFLVHAALAVSNDLFAFRFHPAMRLRRGGAAAGRMR